MATLAAQPATRPPGLSTSSKVASAPGGTKLLRYCVPTGASDEKCTFVIRVGCPTPHRPGLWGFVPLALTCGLTRRASNNFLTCWDARPTVVEHQSRNSGTSPPRFMPRFQPAGPLTASQVLSVEPERLGRRSRGLLRPRRMRLRPIPGPVWPDTVLVWVVSRLAPSASINIAEERP